MNTTAIIQARMTSSRLPGKILLEVLGRPLLLYQIERLRRCDTLDRIILAFTDNETDNVLLDFCREHGVEFFRGDENDVLKRYYLTALSYSVDTVVRVTSDCPLIDPGIVDRVVNHYYEGHSDYDYVSNILERTFPRGMDCEVFSFDVLEKINKQAKSKEEREHVTLGIYNRPESYRLGSVVDVVDNSCFRWTVDRREDFELIKRMIEALYPENPLFTMADCLALLEEHPDWTELNAHIEQKKVSS